MFALVLYVFFRLLKGPLLRNGLLDPEQETATSSYSLAKSQAAWWFFFVLASNLLIGIVTGDFSGSLNATALTLLGIGGATAVIGSVIDNGRSQALGGVPRQEARGGPYAEGSGNLRLGHQDGRNQPAADDSRKKTLQDEKARKQVEWTWPEPTSNRSVARRPALSSATSSAMRAGRSFPRFQVIAWTLVLSCVFVIEVYRRLAMPTFDATLLGLTGINVGDLPRPQDERAIQPQNHQPVATDPSRPDMRPPPASAPDGDAHLAG